MNPFGTVDSNIQIEPSLREINESEQALKQSLSLLNATLESTEDGILVVDRKGKVAAFNRKFLTLWQIPAGLLREGVDEQLLTFVLPQLKDADAFLSRVSAIYRQADAETKDTLEFKDGRVFERYSKPQWIGAEIVGRVWSFRDITRQIKREQSLTESQQRFKLLQEASFGGIAIHDAGKIIDANHGLSEITGYSIPELTGMDGLMLIAPDYREHVVQKTRLAYEFPFDVIGIRKDGSRYHLEIRSKLIPYQKREVLVTEFRDVTGRKQIEEAVREQNTRLVSITENLTRKNAQLEEFTQIVSHNLRSPAGNILALIGLLEQSQGSEQSEGLQHLKESATALFNTLNYLNDVLRIKQDPGIERQHCRLNSVYDDICQMLRARIEELGADVTADFEAVPEIHYPLIYLESILLNLLGNALKYHHPERKPKVHLRTYRLGTQRMLEVSDNGLGIDLQRYGHQIFKMRKTFHNHPEGHGLGLFLIKNQIEAMGGEISVESTVGQGTRFSVNFDKYTVA